MLDNPLILKHEVNVLEMQGKDDEWGIKHTCCIVKHSDGGVQVLATESCDGMICELDESLRPIIAEFLSTKAANP